MSVTPPPPGPPGPGDSGSAADRLWWYRDVRQPAPASRPDRRRWIRRQHLLDALACLALSSLCFSQARHETLFIGDWDFYNSIPLKPPTLLALLLNIGALAAASFLAVRAIRRVRRPAWRRLAALTAAAALFVSLNFGRITHETIGRWTEALGPAGLLALVALALAASLCWPRPALRTIRGIALLASPLGILTLAHALWMFLEVAAGPVWWRVEPAPLTGTPPSLRRVVWVVFADLDQRITFEARPVGFEMPELDRLRRESLYADAARPPAGTTDVSMPALITGRPVVAVSPTSPNELELTFADGKAARWSKLSTVFSRARVLGYDTAVIGWDLPYPRILADSLGLAHWRPSEAHEQARGGTLTEALGNQWGSLVPPVHTRRLRFQRLAELADVAIRTASDGRFGLVLLHLPVPQLPGIYDRATARLTASSFTGAAQGYVDNLALVDRVVGELRRNLSRAGLGDRTWIVVSSTRWWPASRAFDGQLDHRVPFLVRPPDGGRARHVEVAFNTLATHDLVLSILRGSFSDTADAATWLERQPPTPPKDYTSAGRPIY